MRECIIKLLEEYIRNVQCCQETCSVFDVAYRRPNFPENISENIVILHFNKHFESNLRKLDSGDVGTFNEVKNQVERVEVKCFTSDGPISFGPKEAWDHLVLVDGTRYAERYFVFYYVPFSNTSDIIQSIRINKTQTFGEQCLAGRRPRINPQALLSILGEDDLVQKVSEGYIEDLI